MDNLNFLRYKPLDNWIEHFLSPTRFLGLIRAEQRDVKAIAQLIVQFIEQAQVADKELEMLNESPPPDEGDLVYRRCKSAKLWMCALASFASIDWNLEHLKESCNALQLKALFNRLIHFCFPERNLGINDDAGVVVFDRFQEITSRLNKPERLFAAWFYAMWILKMDVDGQFPEVVAKPSVSNPAATYDARLQSAEQIRNCVIEHRQKSKDAVDLLEQLLALDSIREFNVPQMDAFLGDIFKEFEEETQDLASVSAIDPNIIPKPNFETPLVVLNKVDWGILTNHTLLCYHFAYNNLSKAENLLVQIVADWPCRSEGFGTQNSMADRMTYINPQEIGGYCIAFEMTPPEGIQLTAANREQEIFMASEYDDEWIKKLGESDCTMLAFDTLFAPKMSPKLSLDFLIETKREEMAYGSLIMPEERRVICANETSVRKFTEILLRRMSNIRTRESERMQLGVFIQLFAFLDPLFAMELAKIEKATGRALTFLSAESVQFPPVDPLPDQSVFKDILSGGPAYWRLLLSYDVNEIKPLFAQLGAKFKLPYWYQPSKMIGEVLLPAIAGQQCYEYIAMLLGKLEALAKIGFVDATQWTEFGNDCVKELGAIGRNQDVQMRFTYDAVRVKLDKWIRNFPSAPSEAGAFLNATKNLQNIVQGLVQTSATMPSSSLETVISMLLQIVAFLINTAEWDFILKSSPKLKSPFLDIAKVLAAYMTGDPVMRKKVADEAWWKIMHVTFEDPSGKRRNDGSSVRDRTNLLISRPQFLQLLRVIKEPCTISFLLCFIGKLFNHAVVTQSSGTTEKSARIFVQRSDLWQTTFDNWNASLNYSYICECLETILNNACIVNPINAFWLRSFADYRYACEKYADALVLYMETCVACSDNFTKPFPDNVVDDVMWYKIQRCLRAAGQPTLSALVCQLMRDPQEHYVETTNALLETPHHVLDASTLFFGFISDMNLMEFLNGAYEKMGMPEKAQRLRDAIAVPEMNLSNNPVSLQNERSRRNTRLLLTLCAHAFQIHR